MPTGIERFVTPEQDFAGLYRATQSLERRNYRDDQMRMREEEKKEQMEAKRQASGRFFANYLDPKDYFTGTNYDPQVYAMIDEAKNQAYELIGKGAGDSEVLAAISPLVNKVNKYTGLAKQYSANKQELLTGLKQYKGYNVPELSKRLDKEVFFDESGKMRDLDNIDPNDMGEYIERTISKYGGELTSSAGLDEYLKSLPTFSEEKSVRRKNSRGGVEYRKSVVTKPAFMEYDETDEAFVPKYQIATDFGTTQEGLFEKPDGTKVKAPIRLVDEKVYVDILQKRPDIADWLIGQVKSINPDADLKSTQAHNAARAILYNKIKDARLGDLKDIQTTEQPRYTTNNYINTGGGEKGVNPVDLSGYDKTEGGFYDITEMFRGVNFGKVGETLSSDRVLYNPNSRKFMYIDPATKEVSPVSKEVQPVTKEKDFTTFIQDISTSNPQADLKFIKGLGLSGGRSKTETPKPAVKTMSASDFRKLSLTERQSFLNSGGKVQ